MRSVLPLLFLTLGSSVLADDSYFPVRKRTGDPGISEFEANWYGGVLSRMNEPRLPELARDAKAEVFRFTILPTWGNPITVRVAKVELTFRLFARRLDGQAGYDPGQLVEQRELALTEGDAATLRSLIVALNFFALPTEDSVRGFDGDEWILEGVANGKYHMAERWCAASEHSGERGLEAFLALCRFLIDKSTLSERPRNKGYEIFPRVVGPTRERNEGQGK